MVKKILFVIAAFGLFTGIAGANESPKYKCWSSASALGNKELFRFELNNENRYQEVLLDANYRIWSICEIMVDDHLYCALGQLPTNLTAEQEKSKIFVLHKAAETILKPGHPSVYLRTQAYEKLIDTFPTVYCELAK